MAHSTEVGRRVHTGSQQPGHCSRVHFQGILGHQHCCCYCCRSAVTCRSAEGAHRPQPWAVKAAGILAVKQQVSGRHGRQKIRNWAQAAAPSGGRHEGVGGLNNLHSMLTRFDPVQSHDKRGCIPTQANVSDNSTLMADRPAPVKWVIGQPVNLRRWTACPVCLCQREQSAFQSCTCTFQALPLRRAALQGR